jgi:hypothetical protein
MYKFRTMVKDAEERLHEVAHLNVAEGMTKIPDDPRVTRMGKWLRRFSLDELPQLVNVVAGHMSLVGPRPHDKHELPDDRVEHDPRLSMRPGLTGLWQVNARTDPSIARRVHYDLEYVDHWSLTLDLRILAKTIPAVVLGNGGKVEGDLAQVSDRYQNAIHSRSADLERDLPDVAMVRRSKPPLQSSARNGHAPDAAGDVDVSAMAALK